MFGCFDAANGDMFSFLIIIFTKLVLGVLNMIMFIIVSVGCWAFEFCACRFSVFLCGSVCGKVVHLLVSFLHSFSTSNRYFVEVIFSGTYLFCCFVYSRTIICVCCFVKVSVVSFGITVDSSVSGSCWMCLV